MLRLATVQKNTGRRIGELRVVKGKTQAEVAEDLGFSTKYQQLVESGVENLTLESLVRFANYFEVGLLDLLQPPASPPPRRGRPSLKKK